MIIDCHTCDMRRTHACDDCVVAVLVGDDGILELVEAEQAAIESMSKVGLVSPIRLVPTTLPPMKRGSVASGS